MSTHPWLALALERSVRLRALKVAAIVGTVLAIINHADALLLAPVPAAVCFKIALTYLVPYCVSTYASVQAIRHHLQRPEAGLGTQSEC